MAEQINPPAACPAFLIAAPASGQGKTTITAALARRLAHMGLRVRVFKTGPDYLDPQVLAQAAGSSVEPLDLWMAGEAYCRQRLYEAAQEADLILVEGAMGIFDGTPSSADLAVTFGLPLLLLMDVKGMAQTAAALAAGVAHFRSDLTLAGLIANGCATARHRELIEEALPATLPLLANIGRDPAMALPERHLGLVQASEIEAELEARFEYGASVLAETGLAERLLAYPPVVFQPSTQLSTPPAEALKGLTVAVARDEAFSFIYPANVALLTQMGAQLRFFSPLHDAVLPPCDAVWLPGGYPELHAARLAANQPMKVALQKVFHKGLPILAECGGFLYCLEQLTDYDDQTHPMLGLLAGEGAMRGRRGCQGMQSAPLPEGTIRGHAHHRSVSHSTPPPFTYAQRQRHPAPGEAIYRQGGLTASYLHLFFPHNPEAIARLFRGDPVTSSIQGMADATE